MNPTIQILTPARSPEDEPVTTYQREISPSDVSKVITFLLALPEPKPPRAPRKDKGSKHEQAAQTEPLGI